MLSSRVSKERIRQRPGSGTGTDLAGSHAAAALGECAQTAGNRQSCTSSHPIGMNHPNLLIRRHLAALTFRSSWMDLSPMMGREDRVYWRSPRAPSGSTAARHREESF